MLIRTTGELLIFDRTHAAGDLVDVPDDRARVEVARGHAVAVDPLPDLIDPLAGPTEEE